MGRLQRGELVNVLGYTVADWWGRVVCAYDEELCQDCDGCQGGVAAGESSLSSLFFVGKLLRVFLKKGHVC